MPTTFAYEGARAAMDPGSEPPAVAEVVQVPLNASSPVVSVMVPAYRPGMHLCEALQSAQAALAAAGLSAELEVVDDASPDMDVGALLAIWASEGRIRPVRFHRRPTNGGLARCWNDCLARARGEYVHLLHQDDLVRPDFYRRLLTVARENPSAGMLFCRAVFLNENGAERLDRLEQERDGILDEWLPRLCAAQRVLCPAVIVRRSVYEQVGGFDPTLRYIVDWEMWIRIAASHAVAYVSAPLAVYRVHDGAETARIKAAGIVTRDAALGAKRIQAALRRAGRLDCHRFVVQYGISISGHAAYDAERSGNWRVAAKEISLAFRYFAWGMNRSTIVHRLRWLARLYMKAFRGAVPPPAEAARRDAR